MANGEKAIVTSDQHLGYVGTSSSTGSNSEDFGNFLDYLFSRDDVGHVIILGDFIDMWRRDASGLFLECYEFVDDLVKLSETRDVQFVAGNHDFHLLKLEDHKYPFKFQEEITSFSLGTAKYRLRHGWEYDLDQRPVIMEALCHNFSDDAGQIRSDIYDTIEHSIDELKDIFSKHGGRDAYLNNITSTPEQRLSSSFTNVENNAFNDLKPGEILIFGHTHRPFISDNGNLANSGSWVRDALVTNTFLELDDMGQVRLFTFKDAKNITEIKDRIHFPR
jgi:UDP-2,3-diacylglucosamine pyrophosphatase LpxH